MVYNDNFDKEIYEYFRENNQVPHEITQAIYQVNLKSNRIINLYKIKKAIIAIISILTISTGIVFAKDIEVFIKEQFKNFGTGKGVDAAIENGYIAEVEEEKKVHNANVIRDNKIIDNTEVNIEIKSFIMTDKKLDIEVLFEFESKMNDYADIGKLINGHINYEGSHTIILSDMFIVDEENRVIYYNENDKEKFEMFCEENNIENIEGIGYANLDYKTIDNNSENIEVDAVYYIKDIGGVDFPHSKELNIYFSKIKFEPDEYSEIQDEIILEGSWEFHLTVPEIMVNRGEDILYEMVSCENEDFEVYEARATETYFLLGLKIHNMEYPLYPDELIERQKELGYPDTYTPNYATKEEFIEVYGDEKYVDLYEDFFHKQYPILLEGYPFGIMWNETTEGCYILDSNNNKFLYVTGNSGSGIQRNGNFTDNSEFDFYYDFEMTKYDATDNITAVIDFMGKPVKIELRKIN